jgi:hypothetical protein
LGFAKSISRLCDKLKERISISKNKSIAKAALLTLMLLALTLTITVSAQAFPATGYYTPNQLTNVQSGAGIRLPAGVTPDVQFVEGAYISFRPNPVGVGQAILVNLWVVPGPSYTRYFTDYKVTITKPDGTTDTKVMDSYHADSTAWFEYTVDQVGTWKFKFDMPGQFFPTGNYTTASDVSSAYWTESYTRTCYYNPASSQVQTLTVQQNPVLPWPDSPLPTDYWTRPIQVQNREWWTIAGGYPWFGPSVESSTWDKLYPNTSTTWTGQRRFIPWVQGPNTAHVAWIRQIALSGLLGGDQGTYSMQSGSGTPSIVFNGKAYQSITEPFDGTTQSVLECYDIQTGQTFWERTNVPTPTYIEYAQGAPSVEGATASESITTSLVAITNNMLIKLNPTTGAVSLNVSIPSFTSNTYYMNGYVLSEQVLSTTGGPGAPGTPTAGIYRLINWTTVGTSTNFTTRIMNNVSWPRAELFGTTFYWGNIQDYSAGISFLVREPGVWDFANYGFPYAQIGYDNATGIRFGTRIAAYSQKTGATLWDISETESLYSSGACVADHGKLAVLMRDDAAGTGSGYFMCFDEFTGKLLWKSEVMDYPWDNTAFGAYSTVSAYGMFFRFAYSGVYAFDWNTGKIVWKYEAPAFSQFETPYHDANGTTVYSFNSGGWAADGKLYTYNSEHSPTQPITRGWGIHCINITTGEKIWTAKMDGSIGAIDEGYLTVSGNDGNIYVYGKGKSATTVSAPQTAATKGESVIISGTVLDQSPAQAGTPCVSKDSMTTYMEYLHCQMPIDGLWHNETVTGVPVSIDAVDPNNNVVHIATVTTDGKSGSFGYNWTPTITGNYKIAATFAGDDSYGSSSATTYATVVEAPQQSSSSQQQIVNVPDYTMTIIGAAVAVIVAVAIAAVAIILIGRKR